MPSLANTTDHMLLKQGIITIATVEARNFALHPFACGIRPEHAWSKPQTDIRDEPPYQFCHECGAVKRALDTTAPAGQQGEMNQAGAEDMPDWNPMETAPRDGTKIDVKFDPATAERDRMGSLAEFYAPGSTRKSNPTEPVVEGVHFSRGHFRPGDPEDGFHACDISITLVGWRPHTGS